MFEITAKDDSIIFEIASDISVLPSVMGHIHRLLLKITSHSDLNLMLVVRELLVNAISHGNGFQHEKLVHGRIDKIRENGTFRVQVEDHGDGFDFDSLDFSIPEDPRRLRKRGYVIVSALTERVSFNKTGNKVTAYVDLKNGADDMQVAHEQANGKVTTDNR